MDLIVVKFSHLQSLFVLTLQTVLVLNFPFDKVIESKDIPCIIGLGLNLSFSSGLDACFCEIYPIVLVGCNLTELIDGRVV